MGDTRADARTPLLDVAALLLALVISAGLLSMAIESPSYPWFGWITLLPLLAAIGLLRPAWALICGAFWGSSLFVLLSWRGGTHIEPNAQSLLLLCTVPAIFACWASWLSHLFGLGRCALFLGFGWAAVEIALTPLGLNGGLLGGTHGLADGSFVHVLEGVLGYVCMAGFIAAANGLLLSMLSRVCVAGCASRRYVCGSIKTERRFFPQGVPVHLFFFSSPAQPRAPPA